MCMGRAHCKEESGFFTKDNRPQPEQWRKAACAGFVQEARALQRKPEPCECLRLRGVAGLDKT